MLRLRNGYKVSSDWKLPHFLYISYFVSILKTELGGGEQTQSIGAEDDKIQPGPRTLVRSKVSEQTSGILIINYMYSSIYNVLLSDRGNIQSMADTIVLPKRKPYISILFVMSS